jgi:hypothetical protein
MGKTARKPKDWGTRTWGAYCYEEYGERKVGVLIPDASLTAAECMSVAEWLVKAALWIKAKASRPAETNCPERERSALCDAEKDRTVPSGKDRPAEPVAWAVGLVCGTAVECANEDSAPCSRGREVVDP